MLSCFDRLDSNIATLIQEIQNMHLDLDSHSPHSFVDNTLLTGLTTSYDSELSIAHNYEDFILNNLGIYRGLHNHFSIICNLFARGNLSSQTLDKFLVALNSLVDMLTPTLLFRTCPRPLGQLFQVGLSHITSIKGITLSKHMVLVPY
jgi:hypothetical protein